MQTISLEGIAPLTASHIEEWACSLRLGDQVAIYPAIPASDTAPAKAVGTKFAPGTVTQVMPAHLRIEPNGQQGTKPQSRLFHKATAFRVQAPGKRYCLRPVPTPVNEEGGM